MLSETLPLAQPTAGDIRLYGVTQMEGVVGQVAEVKGRCAPAWCLQGWPLDLALD